MDLVVTKELPETSLVASLDSVFDRAWNCLGENSVGILGLYGMGGVGKTTLLKKIHNEFNKRGSVFDIVFWVVISKEVDMSRVQEEIGKKLGLSMPTSNNISNLLKTKKFMLFLDDIWEQIDLSSIGVPSPSPQNKSKIVFTTRSEDICGRMEANKIIRVECLIWEAAWTLFQEKVGHATLSSDSDIPRLAEIVANECRGLPLALITIGRSMASKKTCHEWELAISVLKNYATEFPGMGDNVLPLLKLSYDSLPNDTIRLCFLYCSLYPENYRISIPNLIEQWIGEGYISGFDNFNEALNIGHDIIGILKSVCLLEEASMKWGNKGVKMHDVIRDLALWIACECGKEKNKYIVKAPPAEKWPTMVEKISLKISQLENIPKCPILTTLLVFYDETLERMHNDFFLSMPILRLLDLSYTEIHKLPTSICELVELEFLDLTSTNITSLPSQMTNLTKLKYFSLRNITHCMIPHGIITNLSNLENLKLDVRKDGKFDMEELLCLEELKSLEIRILSDSEVLKKFLLYPKFANCARKLSIIRCNDITSLALSASSSSSSGLCLGHLKSLEYLRIEQCSEIKVLKVNCINKSPQIGGLYESLVKMALHNLPRLIISWDPRYLYCAHFRKLRSVIITGCNAMVNLTWLLFMPKLQTLWIETCNSLQEIISSPAETEGAYDENTFSNLKELSLHNLHNLRSICSMSALPFPSLETLMVRKCGKLRSLPFDSNSANNTLEEIDAEKEWWERLEWKNESIKTHFAKFFRGSLYSRRE